MYNIPHELIQRAARPSEVGWYCATAPIVLNCDWSSGSARRAHKAISLDEL